MKNIIAISAPSGTGKSTLCDEIRRKRPQIKFSVSCTTRPKRKYETDGINYYFLTEDNDSLFVYFTLALGVEELDHFTYDPNVLTIQYFIPPVYSFPSRTEVYDKINDDFDNIADIIPNFSPVCSNSGRLSLQHRLGLIDTP